MKLTLITCIRSIRTNHLPFVQLQNDPHGRAFWRHHPVRRGHFKLIVLLIQFTLEFLNLMTPGFCFWRRVGLIWEGLLTRLLLSITQPAVSRLRWECRPAVSLIIHVTLQQSTANFCISLPNIPARRTVFFTPTGQKNKKTPHPSLWGYCLWPRDQICHLVWGREMGGLRWAALLPPTIQTSFFTLGKNDKGRDSLFGEICGQLAYKLAKPGGDGWHMAEYSTFTPPQAIGFNGPCNV